MYHPKPLLSGRIRDAARGSSLDLHFRPPLWAYVYVPVHYLVLAFLAGGLVANGWAPEATTAGKAMAIGIFAMLILAPIAFNSFASRHSKEELTELLDFLAQHVDAL